MIKNINHIAIIVPDLEGAVAFWEGALGLKLARTESVPEEGVDVAFLPVGDSNVELAKADRSRHRRGPFSGEARPGHPPHVLRGR
jgi:methylmalonyl-CoA/ethylmalonyl-CoA epimerase